MLTPIVVDCIAQFQGFELTVSSSCSFEKEGAGKNITSEHTWQNIGIFGPAQRFVTLINRVVGTTTQQRRRSLTARLTIRILFTCGDKLHFNLKILSKMQPLPPVWGKSISAFAGLTAAQFCVKGLEIYEWRKEDKHKTLPRVLYLQTL